MCVKSFVAVLLVSTIATLASAGKAEEDRSRLEAASARIAQLVSADSVPATTQVAWQMLGSPVNRIIRRGADGTREEEWLYMHSAGWIFMTFRSGRLHSTREFSTSAVYVQDEPEIGSREASALVMLSLIDLGWTRKRVEALGIRPKQRISKEQLQIAGAFLQKVSEDLRRANPSGASEILSIMRFMSGQLATSKVTGDMWTFETRHYTYSVAFDGDEVSQVASAPKLSSAAERVLMSRMAR